MWSAIYNAKQILKDVLARQNGYLDAVLSVLNHSVLNGVNFSKYFMGGSNKIKYKINLNFVVLL